MSEFKIPELPLESAEVISEYICAGHSGRVEAADYLVDGAKLFTEAQMLDFAKAFFELNTKKQS